MYIRSTIIIFDAYVYVVLNLSYFYSYSFNLFVFLKFAHREGFEPPNRLFNLLLVLETNCINHSHTCVLKEKILKLSYYAECFKIYILIIIFITLFNVLTIHNIL